ncbi:bifunctional glutamate N-acetyltransferase/amino-acid acetyltransferase ArgJ [Fructobacillus americanaquae]|uniref:Arginine biosynthesis bifunctional protein ArgJ n=1 Tax=Fructobacillus americanaquae TaxID=2940302 RepID=A0ABY5C405_9LACO|nr:bifunctional glutamate N-acetyltransferase/amino-acid acetyltransferase ArgJ [Fructobacillus americanaquae]USS92563.1 bifunctional glutamate N-acetyltransferase/amino-acid acetyltransferase ArgJ [Fructobacillus americanaquae]
MQAIDFTWPKGFQTGTAHAGFKEDDQLDMAWIVSDVPAVAAGVYTKNQFQAAPVQFTKNLINQNHKLQAVVINSGNANSFTGQEGLDHADETHQLAANQLAINPDLVAVASTGVIGKQLEMEKIKGGLNQLSLTRKSDIAHAILTTDSCEKKITVAVMVAGQPVTITGIAKGSGMIHPNVGTTLGFVTTDASIASETLQDLLSDLIQSSFNQITVDGCMSTNDMVLVLANGQAENELLDQSSAQTDALADFKEGLKVVLVALAKMVAKDGEGSNKFVQATVVNAASVVEANQVARAIVGSNLIKAMLFGEENNWGRIVQAIGQTQAQINPTHLDIYLADMPLVKDSQKVLADRDQVAAILAEDDINLTIDLHVGEATGQAWGCDLTYKYVEINAAYEG